MQKPFLFPVPTGTRETGKFVLPVGNVIPVKKGYPQQSFYRAEENRLQNRFERACSLFIAL